MSSVALLLVAVRVIVLHGFLIASIALPAILLMEVVGADRHLCHLSCRESSRPWARCARRQSRPQ
jgi:hypothetical protein